MIYVNFEVPIDFTSIAKEILELEEMKLEAQNSHIAIDPPVKDILTITYQGSANGFILFYIPEIDFWYTYTPQEKWIRSYIGYDKEYAEEVLIQKYNAMQIFEVEIKCFGKKLPVFVNRPKS